MLAADPPTRGIHRRVPAGAVVFDAHTPCAGFPLILAGTLKVLQRYPNGRELQLYHVRPGESCLLSGSCLLGHANYTASGVAESDVELLVIPAVDFHALIANDAVFRSHVLEVFGERLATLLEIVSRLLRAFEDKGWVDLARERVRLTDRDALAALARA